MTGVEILSLLKDGGYGIAALAVLAAGFFYRQLSAERAARLADINAFNAKILEIATKSIEADKDNTHALTSLTEVLRSRPNV